MVIKICTSITNISTLKSIYDVLITIQMRLDKLYRHSWNSK